MAVVIAGAQKLTVIGSGGHGVIQKKRLVSELVQKAKEMTAGLIWRKQQKEKGVSPSNALCWLINDADEVMSHYPKLISRNIRQTSEFHASVSFFVGPLVVTLLAVCEVQHEVTAVVVGARVLASCEVILACDDGDVV